LAAGAGLAPARPPSKGGVLLNRRPGNEMVFRFTIIRERYIVINGGKRAEGIEIIREGVESGSA
jgi:hypothetical protein